MTKDTTHIVERAMTNIERKGKCIFTEGTPNKPPKLLIQVEERVLRAEINSITRSITEALEAEKEKAEELEREVLTREDNGICV